MEYKAFALQYRPQAFSEVIGQGHIVQALKDAITTNRIHHAYLFSGPRGVGKTSLARIFAKSLNCEIGPTAEPCGKCANCVEITKGTSMDVIEVDGASNRGIDEIRELRESAKLSTVKSRFKIYIIDEVHMLTTEAFNALLKTLEEPPTHVKFLFATTHPQKVLPTILSRCQKFQCVLLPMEQIAQKLKRVAEAEKINVSDALLFSIARAAGGSIRDAESLFDQLAPVIEQKGDTKDILSFLGILDDTMLNEALEALLNKNITALLLSIDRSAAEGKDLGLFLSGLIEQLRNVVLAKVSPKAFSGLTDMPQASREFFVRLAAQVTIVNLFKALDQLLQAKELSVRLNSVRIPLELAVVKFAYSDELAAVVNIPPSAAPKGAPTRLAVQALKTEMGDEFELEIDNLDMEAKSKSAAVADSKNEPLPQAEGEDNILLAQVKPRWPEIIAKMQKVRAAIASHLTFSRLVSSVGPMLHIGFGKKDMFHKESIEAEKNRIFVEKFITDIIGKKVNVKFIVMGDGDKTVDIKPQPAANKAVVDSSDEDDPGPQDDDFVNEILDAFNGKLDTGK